MKRTVLGLAVVTSLAGGRANLAKADAIFDDLIRARSLVTLVLDSCRPLEGRRLDARKLLKAMVPSTPLDTMPASIASIWFRTDAPDINIPQQLRSEHPTDMLIVLEYQYRGLMVTEETIAVTVRFKGVWVSLIIPWNDVIMVSDEKTGNKIDLRKCP